MSQDSLTSLRRAIAIVQSRGIVVVKTQRNSGLNSDYASYADVWEMLKPQLAEAQLSVGFAPGSASNESSAWKQRLTLIVTSLETGDSITHDFDVLFPEGNRGVNLTQRQGMAHTYGKRYALIDFFHLITGDDDDAQRLGMPERSNSAPQPKAETHWSTLCHVPCFGTGSGEAERAWSMLADPSDTTGERMLGDNAPGVLAKLWARYPDHPGLNAWRAELVGERAAAKSLTWGAILVAYRTLNLPDRFEECTGEQLANLALALK